MVNNLELDVSELNKRFAVDGYVIVPEFLSKSELDSMVSEIVEHYGKIDLASGNSAVSKGSAFAPFATEVVPWDPVADGNSFFAALLDNPRLAQITLACLGPGYSESQSLVMLSPPGGLGQAWHQDCPVGDGKHYNVNRLIYVEDVTPDNGAIVIVPGSHRSGVIPSGGPQEHLPGEVALTPSAGMLVLLHGHVYHRVTPNISANPRTSVNFRAYPAGVSPDVCSIGVFRNGAFDFRTNEVVGHLPLP